MGTKGIPISSNAKRLSRLPILLTCAFVALSILVFWITFALQNKDSKPEAETTTAEMDLGAPLRDIEPPDGMFNPDPPPEPDPVPEPQPFVPDRNPGPQQNGPQDPFANMNGIGLDPAHGSVPPPPQPTALEQYEEQLKLARAQLENEARYEPTMLQFGGKMPELSSTSSHQQGLPTSFPIDPENPLQTQQLPQHAQSGQFSDHQDEKKAFLENSGNKNIILFDGYRKPLSPYELKRGRLVPIALISEINSDLPGYIRAMVTEDVYDSISGNHLLIPKGTFVFGVYDSKVVFGQKRILVAWQSLDLPDGATLNLGSMPGVDAAGTAGLQDLVDNHYLRIFGGAVLMSVINAGFTIATDTDSSGESESVQDILAKASATEMQSTFANIIKKLINIQPELIIRQGKTGNIILTKDVVGLTPYTPEREQTYYLN